MTKPLEQGGSVAGRAARRGMTSTAPGVKCLPSEPCLACHGSNFAAEIGKLYPQDAATGFKAGELRGAFSVRMPAE